VRFDMLRGDLQAVEEDAGAFGIDATVEKGVVDFRDGEQDGGGALGRRKRQGAEPVVATEGVHLGVKVAEVLFPEGR